MHTILLLEDDENLNRGITITLQKAGYNVLSAFTLSEAKKYLALEAENISLVICDITLPDGNGLDFGKRVREASSIYLIYLTALDTETDIVNGYAAGADDYITKPFSLMVLVSKVHALARRIDGAKELQNTMTCGDITVDCKNMRVSKHGQELVLSKKELQLLAYLWENAGQIVSKESILEHVWDIDGQFVDHNTVTVNISRLKNKLGTNEISNVRGLGYIWTGKVIKKIRKFIVNYLIFCILFSSFMLVLAGYENYLNRRRILALTANDPTLAAKVITIWKSTQKCLIPDEPAAHNMQESIHIMEDKYGYELHRLASDPILWLFWGTGLFAGLLYTSALAYMHFYKSRQGSESLKRQQELYECLEQYRNGNYEYIPDYTNASEEWLKIGESLRELGVYFSALRQQLKTEENNTKTFITDISHQLKTPLASLKMSYELAAGNWLNEVEKKEFFTRGEKEIEKLELLLHELVKLSRLETHMIQLTPVLTGFRRTLTAAVSQIYMKAKDKNIDICIHMENDIILRHDIKWTEEAIANVLDNCVKYSSEHTVVTVRVIPLVANILLEIEDEGMGIRPEELQKIYQRFYRGAQAKQKTKEGAGVGLYLARMILERQGGTISARRKIDKNGTVFKITLPLEPERLQKIPYKTVIEL